MDPPAKRRKGDESKAAGSKKLGRPGKDKLAAARKSAPPAKIQTQEVEPIAEVVKDVSAIEEPETVPSQSFKDLVDMF